MHTSSTIRAEKDIMIPVSQKATTYRGPGGGYRPSMHLTVVAQMLDLRNHFNDMESHCERECCLDNMEKIIDDAPTHLADNEQDNFAIKFMQLCQTEQTAFLEIAETAFLHRRPISVSEIDSLYSKPPSRPFYVDLSMDSSTAYQDGSERFPFCSVELACLAVRNEDSGSFSKVIETEDIMVACCGSNCNFAVCGHSNCEEDQLCTVHGTGRGIFRPGMAKPVFDVEHCMDCKTVTCLHHNSCKACDLCTFDMLAASPELSVTISPFRVCRSCAHSYQSPAIDGKMQCFTCCSPCSVRFECTGIESADRPRPAASA